MGNPNRGGQLVNVDSTVTDITGIIESIDNGTPIIIEQDGVYYTVTSGQYDTSNVTLEIIKDGNHCQLVINRTNGNVSENNIGVELVSDGDGNSYLANDGTYKEINSSVIIPVDLILNERLGSSGNGDGYDFSQIYNAYISGENCILILKKVKLLQIICYLLLRELKIK